jgi:hypothetical protein
MKMSLLIIRGGVNLKMSALIIKNLPADDLVCLIQNLKKISLFSGENENLLNLPGGGCRRRRRREHKSGQAFRHPEQR